MTDLTRRQLFAGALATSALAALPIRAAPATVPAVAANATRSMVTVAPVAPIVAAVGDIWLDSGRPPFSTSVLLPDGWKRMPGPETGRKP